MIRTLLNIFLVTIFLCVATRGYAQKEWTKDFCRLADSMEHIYGLPHGVAYGFNMKENSGRLTDAQSRVEANFYNVGEPDYKWCMQSSINFLKDTTLPYHIPLDEERLQEASSWGPWQLVAVNERAMGCKEVFMANVGLTEHLVYFCRFFQTYMKRWKTLAKAVRYYNGAKSPASYTTDVLKYISQAPY